MDLVEFLLVRRQDARDHVRFLRTLAAVLPEGRAVLDAAEHIEREAEARRRIMLEHQPNPTGSCDVCSADANHGYDRVLLESPCPTLRLLASPYAGHPDYDESWRL